MASLGEAFRKPSYADLQQFEMQQQMEQYMQSMRENQRRESLYGDTGTIRMPTHPGNVQEGFNKITGYSPEMNRAEKAALGAEWLMPLPAKGTSALFPLLGGVLKGGMSKADKLVQKLTNMKDLSKVIPMDEASRMQRAKDQGYNTQTYHWSPVKDIDEFKTRSELGLHSGDRAAAQDMKEGGAHYSEFMDESKKIYGKEVDPTGEGELTELLIRSQNPYEAPKDIGRWDTPALWSGVKSWGRKDASKNLPEKQRFEVNALARKFMKKQEKLEDAYKPYNLSEFASPSEPTDPAILQEHIMKTELNKVEFGEQLKKLFEKFGFDSIAYKNEVEGIMNKNAIKSYISFKPQDIRRKVDAMFIDPKSKSSLMGIGGGALVAPALTEQNEWNR